VFAIELVTRIEAPVQRCFDLACDVETHCRTAAFTGERAVPPGRLSGNLELGDRVTFEAVHFGVRQRLTARIVEMEPPLRFVDEQERGPLRRLRHTHEFRAEGAATLMTDRIEGASPFGPLGALADRLLVAPHLERFLQQKQALLKELAETGALRDVAR
jgi:ligand-binding SRPBCC domain-containing protein